MEGFHIFRKNFLKLAHLPTLMLVVGYPVFWLEMFVIQKGCGQTSYLAVSLFFIIASIYTALSLKDGKNASDDRAGDADTGQRWLIRFGLIISLGLILCAFYASLFPPHLAQEMDAIHYHITLPRQHLILGSFDFIPWAADDLFLLPVNYGLAPYWLVTELPNKIPQFFFLCGVILVSLSLSRRLGATKLSGALIPLAILGSHHVGIQMGSAMLDLVLCYLLLAAIDSFMDGRMVMCTIEAAFYVWSKGFLPIQILAIAALMAVLFKIINWKKGYQLSWAFEQAMDQVAVNAYIGQIKKYALLFVILSAALAGPFMMKSMAHAGTPLFPFATGSIMINPEINQNSAHWKSLEASANTFMTGVRDNYGHGRSISAFIKHFWLLAVPEKGVNNSFDYPLGLIYLLVLFPFVALFFRSLNEHKFAIIPFFIALSWLSWWFGSQQSRFLYVPVILMVIAVISKIRKSSNVLIGMILIALTLNALSVVRAHKRDWGKSHLEVLRKKDLKLIDMNREYKKRASGEIIDLDFHDAAFAQFPVRVIKEKLPHTLAL